jgi:nitrogenase subunit NifH
MDTRVRGHNHLLEELKSHSVLGPLLIGVIPANEAVSYAHHNHQSLFSYDPKAPASKAYAQLVGKLVQRMAKGGVMPPQKDSTRMDDLLASVTADLLEGGSQTFQDNSLRLRRKGYVM